MRRLKLLVLFLLSFLLIPGVKALDTTTVSKVYNTKYGVLIKWNKDDNALGYNIYRKEAKGKYILIKTVTGKDVSTYLDTKIKKKYNVKFKYAVRSYNNDELSSYNAKSTIRLETPTLDGIKLNKKNKASFIFDKDSKVTGYHIQIATDKGFRNVVKNVVVKNKKLSSTKVKLKKGIVFYFRIRSYKQTNNGKKMSEWSNTKSKIVETYKQKLVVKYARSLVSSKNYTRDELANQLIIIGNNKKIYFSKRDAYYGVDNCGRLLKDEEKVLFAGDSLTARYNINYYYNYSNKLLYDSGMNGYTTSDILDEYNSLIGNYKVNKLFLLIGTNDFNLTSNGDVIFNNIKKVINKIKTTKPNTKLYLQSLYPINTNIRGKNEIRNNKTIIYINSLLKTYCENNNVTYIDTYSKLVDSNGNLDAKYTVDGLHLSETGYSVVTQTLLPYVN